MAESFAKELSGLYARLHLETVLLPQMARGLGIDRLTDQAIRTAWTDPRKCLRALLTNYAFRGSGSQKATLGILTGSLLDAAPGELEQLDVEALVNQFSTAASKQASRGTVIRSLITLAQEALPHSLAFRLAKIAESRDGLTQEFESYVGLPGLGPKIVSLFFRDACYVFDVEGLIPNQDKIAIQPVDRWGRQFIRELIIPEPDSQPADWVVAGKLNKLARITEVSGIRLNMGITYFGERFASDPADLVPALVRLHSPDSQPVQS